MADLKDWLERHALGRHHARLVENGIDLDILADLTEADLISLDLTLGDRRRMMRAIDALRTPDRVDAPASASASSGDAERRQITLVFIDLVGSTRLSEMLDLDAYHDALNGYLNACARTIRAHGGHVALLIGDGVVGYFGYPTAQEDDAERAVRAGLDACRAVRDLPAPAGTPLEVRVGISTGDVIVDARMADRGLAMGDVPNLAARLQAFAEPGTVAISDRTRRLLGRNFDCAWRGEHAMTGFDAPVGIWTVHDVEQAILRFEAQHGDDVTPIVNRIAELSVLRDRWTKAKDAGGQLVMLSGEAGIGKSRLLQALADWIGPEGCVRLNFQCSPSYGQSAFHPVVSFLSGAADIRRADGNAEKRRKLAALVATWPEVAADEALPLLRELLSIPAPGTDLAPIPPARLRSRIRDLLVRIVLGLSAERPVLLLVEDLHWIDPSTEELLDALFEELQDARVMIVCTYRPDTDDRWTGRARATRLSIARLTPQHSQEMVRTMLRDSALSRKLERRIVERTDGVPLFIEEMVRMVESRDADAAAGAADRPLELPSTLKDLLRARIDRLGAARDLAPLCAVIGRDIQPAMIETVLEIDRVRLDGLLEELVSAQILVPALPGSDRGYGFRHALIRDVAYGMMVAATARDLHRKVALTIARDFPDQARRNPEVHAQHYAIAGMHLEARAAWERAAALATRRFATREAIGHLNAAIAANDRLPDGADRDREELALRKRLDVALDTLAFGSAAAQENFERITALLDRVPMALEDACLTLHVRIGADLMTGDASRARDLCGRIHELVAPEDSDPTMRALAAHDEAMARFMLGEFDAADGWFGEALARRETISAADVLRVHASDIRVVDRAMRLWARGLAGEEGPALREEIGALASEIEAEPHAFTRCFGLNVLATALQPSGDVDAVAALTVAAREISTRYEFEYWDAWNAVVHGWARARRGDAPGGIAEIEAGLAAYLATGSRQMRSYAGTLLADAHLAGDDPKAARAALAQVAEWDAKDSVRYHRIVAERVASAVAAADGDT
jgi:class 3 adenylate cyclase